MLHRRGMGRPPSGLPRRTPLTTLQGAHPPTPDHPDESRRVKRSAPTNLGRTAFLFYARTSGGHLTTGPVPTKTGKENNPAPRAPWKPGAATASREDPIRPPREQNGRYREFFTHSKHPTPSPPWPVVPRPSRLGNDMFPNHGFDKFRWRLIKVICNVVKDKIRGDQSLSGCRNHSNFRSTERNPLTVNFNGRRIRFLITGVRESTPMPSAHLHLAIIFHYAGQPVDEFFRNVPLGKLLVDFQPPYIEGHHSVRNRVTDIFIRG